MTPEERQHDAEIAEWTRSIRARPAKERPPTWGQVVEFVGLCALLLLLTAPAWLPAFDQMTSFYGGR